jgi:transcriptional regulator with XRE-family HTH domain
MDLGLTLMHLARQLGVGPWTVANWEHGRTGPAVRFLPAIHTFLGYCPLKPALTLGGRLQQARNAAGLSRRELGRKIGLDEGTIARLERGMAKRPTQRTAAAITAFLPSRG